MKVSELKTNPNNPRKISGSALDKLKQSIERDPAFMALRPIVIDENNVVLGGNQRLKAIKALGMKEMPDTWVIQAKDLTEEQRRRFVLVDNAPEGMSGEWDFELLTAEWDMPELEDLGFGVDELESVESLDELPFLPDGDKEPFQQMTFTLHDEQVEQVKAALDISKSMGAFDSQNENSNGNALARICETFLTNHDDS
jgi:hypothetical protein